MAGSTQLSATSHDKSTAGVYRLFTGTAVRLFHEFAAPYIDVRGDGVFALFNGDQPYRAIAAAVTFKTFAEIDFVTTVNSRTDLDVGCHIGVDQRTVLVRKIGLKRNSDRSDRQNEVWAGRPINMSAKLASLSAPGELLVSDRYFRNIRDELVRNSCGCPDGVPKPLWTEIDVSGDKKFDFDRAYKLESKWCSTHGSDFCDRIIALEED